MSRDEGFSQEQPPKVLSRLLTPGCLISVINVVNDRVKTLVGSLLVYRRVCALMLGFLPGILFLLLLLAQNGENGPSCSPTPCIPWGFDHPEGGLLTVLEGLAYSCFPCAGVLSVAGLLAFPLPFPLGFGLFPEQKDMPDMPGFLIFLSVLHIVDSSVRRCSVLNISRLRGIRRPSAVL